MATTLDLIQEAYKRGLPVPDDKAALYDEAVKRGLVQDARPGVLGAAAGYAKAAGEGIKRGAVSTLNAINDFGAMARDKVGEMTGISPEALDAAAQVQRNFGIGVPSSTPTATKKVEQVTGPAYQPKNRGERYTETAGEFAVPSLLLGPNMLKNAVSPEVAAQIGPRLPEATSAILKRYGSGLLSDALTGGSAAVGSEAAGQATEGSWIEPWARLAGGVVGGTLPDIARRAITPLPVNAERQASIDRLKAEGVPLSAGQQTGRRGLGYMESELGGGSTADLTEAQTQALTAAAAKRAGINADKLTPQVMQQAYDGVDQTFTALANQTAIPLDTKLQDDLLQAVTRYQDAAGMPAKGPENIMNRVAEVAAQNNGVLPGPVYRGVVTELRKMGEQNPELRGVVSDMRTALDNGIERNLSGDLRTAWRNARQQYAALKVLEGAVTGAGEKTAEGMVTPGKLRSAVDAATTDRQYLTDENGLPSLARAATNVMTPLPDSGTSMRRWAQGVGSGVSAIAAGLMGYNAGFGPLGLLGAVGGGAVAPLAMPYAAGKALMSRPVQAYLANQLMTGRGLGTGAKLAVSTLGNASHLREALAKLLEGKNNGP